MKSYKHIIFDFDGVLAETNEIRVDGFAELFKNYPSSQVERLLQYARMNGGMSRYEKIRYFFDHIICQTASDEQIQELAMQYSHIVKQKVIDAPPVSGSEEFLGEYGKMYDLAIVSGSDQNELREVCKARGIAGYFMEILGSPRNKKENIAVLFAKTGWEPSATVFVGDSINDYEAAHSNNIDFIARDGGHVEWAAAAGVAAVIRDISALHTFL